MSPITDSPITTVVTAIIPCLNEEKFIGKCLNSIIAQDFPAESWEVLCVLGPSIDGTEKILQSYTTAHPNIRVLANPYKNTAVSFNIGIKAARGEFVFTLGAHTTYSPNYFSVARNYLRQYECVGSIAKTEPQENTFLGRAICEVLSSPFGVGGSKMRTGLSAPVETDTASCPGYRREVFSKIGCFNEKLKHTQDMEFNRRLKRSGGKILATPEIVSYYKARSRFSNYCRANFVNGFWSIYPFKFCVGIPVSTRHLVPLSFIGTILLLSVLSFLGQLPLLLLTGVLIAYFSTAVFFSFSIALKQGEFRYIFVLPVLFFLLHSLYGAGSVVALTRIFPRDIAQNGPLG